MAESLKVGNDQYAFTLAKRCKIRDPVIELRRAQANASAILVFFVALCHVLQEGENELTARDCYWLGLVDEVIGDPQLSNLPQIVEFAPASEADSPDE